MDHSVVFQREKFRLFKVSLFSKLKKKGFTAEILSQRVLEKTAMIYGINRFVNVNHDRHDTMTLSNINYLLDSDDIFL